MEKLLNSENAEKRILICRRGELRIKKNFDITGYFFNCKLSQGILEARAALQKILINLLNENCVHLL